MLKTKIKKAIAIASIAGMTATTLGTSLGTTFAATVIGSGSVAGTGAFNSSVIWDDAFPGFATGSVSGIKVKAKVLPTLNMTLSASEVNLGTLVAGVPASGTIDIEVGTNAKDGVSITARSGSGGLTNLANNSVQMNNLSTDGIAESYTFASNANAIDSTVAGFVNTTGNLASTEVNNNSTEHVIYTTNKPEKLDFAVQDLTFTVAATADAQTQAGDYEDTITFTVTGKF
ncbi:MAG: hypothetical protein PHH98_03520 [Candidatus Gracilibacteria bacterium]|nr:hypothetical protein [Candidatus Gracilibacteria bacterium]